MDFLSFCPSLVEILQGVDHNDILNCNLVNRRMLDTIKRNSISMPRPLSTLNISMFNESSTQSSYVSVAVILHSRWYNMYVTDGNTILLQHLSSIEDYYKENRIQHCSQPSLCGKKILDSIWVDGVRRRVKANCIYRNGSLEEGLRTLLSLLFRRYYFSTIDPCRDFPEDLLSIVGDEFHRNRSKCNILYSSYKMKGLQGLITKLDCKTTVFMGFFNENTHFMNEITDIVSWNRPIRAIFHQQSDSLQSLALFLQKWESGLFSLGKVTVSTYSVSWPQSLYDILLSLKRIVSDNTDFSKIPEGKRRVRVARTHDEKVLRLTFYGRIRIEIVEE